MDYAALFAATPSPYLVLNPDLVIVAVNQAYLAATGREREELIGRYVFDAFPDNPSDPDSHPVRNLEASLNRALAGGERDSMALQKYDIPVPGREGQFEERYWSQANTPVRGPDGSVVLVIHRAEDVTEFVRGRERSGWEHGLGDNPQARKEAMETELYARARDLQELNERLRQEHAREREVALALQQAMLPVIPSVPRRPAAVRYRPAGGLLNVCGDWYDLIDLDEDRFGVTVGDVVGQGLGAAGVMGQLRSALGAAVRAVDGPARALDILDVYARSIDRALSTTVVQAVVDLAAQRVTYSSAGHPPPLLLHADGSVEALDAATDPPLAVRPETVPRPQAEAAFEAGAALVLYTDGLVERRGEDIDSGVRRLADSLSRHRGLGPEPLADALLGELGATDGVPDDTALVVIRL
ncbi:SpoIIE family protein phosphatase [Streptomyces sp. NPDC002055]|uniref:PP2C family protein-serine/threonine phosphatase n=1 Tax=Streptomyces sp. NPDC002055 TaxID=3154534 RepID=UPI00331F0084